MSAPFLPPINPPAPAPMAVPIPMRLAAFFLPASGLRLCIALASEFSKGHKTSKQAMRIIEIDLNIFGIYFRSLSCGISVALSHVHLRTSPGRLTRRWPPRRFAVAGRAALRRRIVEADVFEALQRAALRQRLIGPWLEGVVIAKLAEPKFSGRDCGRSGD